MAAPPVVPTPTSQAQMLSQLIAAEFAPIFAEMAKCVEAINSILEKISALEERLIVAPERATRTAAAEKSAARAKAAAENRVVVINPDRVKNARLFTRFIWATDADFRFEYGGNGGEAETQRIADLLAAIKNIDKKISKEEKLVAEGAYMWDSVFTEEQKESVKAKFLEWKNARTPLVVD